MRQTWSTCTHWSVLVVYCILGSPPWRCMPIKELLGTPRTMNVFFPSLHLLYLSFSWATITTCVCHIPSHRSFPSYTLQINILRCLMKGWSCQGWWFDTLQMAFLRLWPRPFLWNVRFDFAKTNIGSYIVDYFLWFKKHVSH
jgi:hypothetical protein